MSALVLSAVEQRVYRALVAEADRQDLPLTHRQVQSLARIAARAARQSRPKDSEAQGRKTARKPPERPSERRSPVRESRATPEGHTGAPGAVSAIRGAA